MSTIPAVLFLISFLLAAGHFVVEGLRLWEFGIRLVLRGRMLDRLDARTLEEGDWKRATPGQLVLYRCLRPEDAFAAWVRDGRPSVPRSLATRMLKRAADRRRARGVA